MTIFPTKPVPHTTTRFGSPQRYSSPELTIRYLPGDGPGVVGGEEGGDLGHLSVFGHPA